MTAPEGSRSPEARRRQRWLVVGAVGAAVLLVAGVAAAFGGADGDEVVASSTTTSSSTTTGPTTTLRFDAPPSQPLGTVTTTTAAPATTTTTSPPSTTTEPPPVTAPPPKARPGPTIESSAGRHQALRAALAEAETRWSRQDRSGGYVFRTQRRCFCPASDNEITVDASGTVAGQRTRSGDAEPDPPTIDDVFAAISGAITADADQITVSFDRDLGFPVEVRIDFDEEVADDEQGRSIDWLVLRAPG